MPYGGNNDDFLRVTPLDRTAMADPASYVEDYLNHIATGRMSPFEAATYLGSAADSSEKDIEAASGLNPSAPQEFDCIRRDIQAVAWLGRYYRDRIISVTHLAFYRRTYHHPELTAAHEYLQRALTDWDNLSEVTEQHFGYVPELIRMGVNQFRWRDEGRSLGVDLAQINNLEAEFRDLPEQYAGRQTTIGHVPAFKIRPGEPLKLTITYARGMITANSSPIFRPEANVFVFYRNSQQTGYTKAALHPDNPFERTWSGVIPAEEIVPGQIEYYFEANQGTGMPYGGTLEHRPPYRVYVTADDSKPVITHDPPRDTARKSAITLTVGVQSKSKISSVRVYYKPMPAYDDWVTLDMSPAGLNQFTAKVPLTPEGILYYFEAADESGNAANYPYFLVRTPYFSIEGWDPNTVSASAPASSN